MMIPFGEFAPDLAELGSSVSAVALNVYPALNSYTPVLGADTAYSDALPAAPRGLFLGRKQNGTFVAFAGTAATLQRLDGTSWTEIGSGFAVPTDEFWSFTQFGQYVIATNIVDGPQVYDIEAGGTTSALGGSPPNARFVDVIEDYVVLASLDTDAFAIAWSDTNDAANWTTGNSGSQSFPDGGRVQNFAGAAKRVVQETVHRQMIHAPGSAEVFQFTKVEQAKGTISPYSVIKFGPWMAYLAEDGFWFNDKNISAGRITKYFFDNIDRTRLFSVIGSFDPNRPIFYWLARTTGAETYDFGLMYNWQADRWSQINPEEVLLVSNMATTNMTLEQIAALFASLEVITPSLDSRVWQGGRPVFAVINSDFELCFFEGDAMEATLETGMTQHFPEHKALIRSIRPAVNTSAAMCYVKRKERLADSFTTSAESSMQTSGECPMKVSGRYIRHGVRIPAASTWSNIQGVEVKATRLGLR
jgi:hypothetical protein